MYKFRSTDLSTYKEIFISLKKIYGVGWHKSKYILAKLGLAFPFFIFNLIFIEKIYYFFY
jgi:ribosomal protein S13